MASPALLSVRLLAALLALCLAAAHGADTQSLGAVTALTAAGSSVQITAGTAKLQVLFYSADIFRIWAAFDGNFTDPAKEIVMAPADTKVKVVSTEATDHYDITWGGNQTLRVLKSPCRFSLLVAGATVWAETQPLSWNASTTFQTLATQEKEYFFGGGMQNGRFSHKGNAIRISTDYNWANGGNPNSAPFYLSTSGYGVYRNTWAPAYYNFMAADHVVTGHNESRFDAFFFTGGMKEVLGQYTTITGKPFMPPIYGMGLGDSDCYHNVRHNNSTRVVLAVADQYRRHQMPGAWFLPNDGYGCGFGEDPVKFPKDFTDLDFVVKALHERGFYTGLWSSTGLPNITREVKGSGTRVAKTDVGWIGRGYAYAFESVQMVAQGIENNSDARRFIWTVEGWAGTQRYAVMWTGDDTGSFEYIRWQLTTFVGTGFSALAHVSGDIDGIFGGSPDTYVRDLQFKCFMTTMMSMSGWASNPDKQPWTYGEPYTSINRMYLKLKMRLTPYFYSFSRVAYDTGVAPVRAMALEFPNDPKVLYNWTGSAYQFMSGDWLLVAPVYEDSAVRDGIYLPEGVWIDFWNQTVYQGNTTLDGYSAPLTTLPVLVRAGAILPMWPDMLYFDEAPHDPLTIHVYPTGDSSFDLYEDDGVTRQALNGGTAFATTRISASAPADYFLNPAEQHSVSINVSARAGSYAGAPAARGYTFVVHAVTSPLSVLLDGQALPPFQSIPAVEYAQSGWYFNKVLHTVLVKVPSRPASKPLALVLSHGPSYNHLCLLPCDSPQHHQVIPQTFDFETVSGRITVRKQPSLCITVGKDHDPASNTPALELQPCSAAKAATQAFVFDRQGDARFRLNSSLTTCMDQDGADEHVEMYPCHSSANDNQQWVLEATTGHIATADRSRCMSPCAPLG